MGWLENRESPKDLQMRLLVEKIKALGRLPTWDEVKDDKDMPNPNDYAYYWGSFDKALATAGRSAGIKVDPKLGELKPGTHNAEFERDFKLRQDNQAMSRYLAKAQVQESLIRSVEQSREIKNRARSSAPTTDVLATASEVRPEILQKRAKLTEVNTRAAIEAILKQRLAQDQQGSSQGEHSADAAQAEARQSTEPSRITIAEAIRAVETDCSTTEVVKTAEKGAMDDTLDASKFDFDDLLEEGDDMDHNERKKEMLLLLAGKVQALGRLPTWDEVKADPDLPDPDVYSLTFGSLDRALDKVRERLNKKKNSSMKAEKSTAASTKKRKKTERQKQPETHVASEMEEAKSGDDALNDEMAEETSAVTETALSENGVSGDETTEEANMDTEVMTLEPEVAMADIEAVSETETSVADETAEPIDDSIGSVTDVNDAEVTANEATEEQEDVFEATEGTGAIEEAVSSDDEINLDLVKASKRRRGRAPAYELNEVIDLLKRARRDNDGVMPIMSDIKSKKFKYLPSEAVILRLFGTRNMELIESVVDSPDPEKELENLKRLLSDKTQLLPKGIREPYTVAEIIKLLKDVRSKHNGEIIVDGRLITMDKPRRFPTLDVIARRFGTSERSVVKAILDSDDPEAMAKLTAEVVADLKYKTGKTRVIPELILEEVSRRVAQANEAAADGQVALGVTQATTGIEDSMDKPKVDVEGVKIEMRVPVDSSSMDAKKTDDAMALADSSVSATVGGKKIRIRMSLKLNVEVDGKEIEFIIGTDDDKKDSPKT